MTHPDDDKAPVNPLDSRQGRRQGLPNEQRKRKFLVRVGFGAFICVFLMGAAAGLLAYQATMVRGHLEQAMHLIPQLRADLGDGNTEEAQRTFSEVQEEISAARSTVTGPLWKAATAVPVVGANFDAVKEVSVSADDVATRAVAPLLDRYESLDWTALTPTDGRIDAKQLQEAAPGISTAANTVRLSYERMASIDLSQLMPQVADPVSSATMQLGEASHALQSASSAAQLLPSMLGTGEQRNYLLLVQNSAEVRATGGISGALAVLSVDDGQVSLGQQGSASAIGAFKPALKVDAQQEQIYTARLGTQMQNVNLTPDFPTAASTAKSMWETRYEGTEIDGVMAIDPVVLASLLGATGPVDLVDPQVLALIGDTSLPSSLTQENVVKTLLSDVYGEIDEPALQDLYFASVAQEVFSAFTSGSVEGSALVDALVKSSSENRIRVWSSRSAEQDLLESTPVGGLATGPTVGGATFGMYYNDGTGAKMDYYVRRQAQLIQPCDGSGYSRFTVRVTIENTAPLDASSSLPAYVTGGGAFGVDPGRVRSNYVAYGPAQSLPENATLNGQPIPIASYRHDQRPVGMVAVELGPGESASLDITFSKVVQSSEPELQVTPTLMDAKSAILPAVREASCG